MGDTTLVAFAILSGFTASGICANAYRLFVKSEKTDAARIAYGIVMIVAGPSMLFEKAATGWRQKSWSGVAFGLMAALCFYWSFALGLFVIQVAISF